VEVVPSILVALLHTPYDEKDYSGIKKLKFIGCGSAPLPVELQNKIHQKFDLKVANLYGLSETGPTHVDYPLDEGWKPGSIGKPLDVNQVDIMNENGNMLDHDQVGEIVVKGENVFIGYHGNQEIYDKLVVDGYFHTGDLGYKSKDGVFYFTGRKKDLIIKGGINISPDEIDEIIFKLDEVKEATTVGMEDEYLGEKIFTYIVLKDGKKLNGEKVKSFCKKFLSKEKIPDVVKFVESLPKGPSGKILRREMRN
jgi:long-chain acyl-CoA synthetase